MITHSTGSPYSAVTTGKMTSPDSGGWPAFRQPRGGNVVASVARQAKPLASTRSPVPRGLAGVATPSQVQSSLGIACPSSSALSLPWLLIKTSERQSTRRSDRLRHECTRERQSAWGQVIRAKRASARFACLKLT